MRRKRTTRAAAAIAAGAILTSALASPIATAAVAEESQPVVKIANNLKGQPVLSPSGITMHLSSPNGCNFVVTNSTGAGRLIGYGTDRYSFERAC